MKPHCQNEQAVLDRAFRKALDTISDEISQYSNFNWADRVVVALVDEKNSPKIYSTLGLSHEPEP